VNPAEIHPEEMLDAARAGWLDSRGWVDLRAHLRRCPACRLQLKLASDLRNEGRSRRADDGMVDGLIQAALLRPSATVAGSATANGSRFGFGASPLLRRLLLPAACLLLGGGVATAMLSVRLDFGRGPTIEPLPVAHHVSRAKVRHASRSVTHPTPAPEKPAPPAPPVRRSLAMARPHVAAPTPVVAESAEVLFADANRARRAGDYANALTRYRRLRSEFAGSREEITARVIVGQLVLAESRPGLALTEFESYLAASPGGTLAEEARAGRAAALMALSRPDDERAAWLEFLKRHPGSMHADRARARLKQLRP
jgi:hypothetical protein